jgi:hypothetical protein
LIGATIDDKINRLTTFDIARINTHLEAALDNTTGSGDHWILMAYSLNMVLEQTAQLRQWNWLKG